jgi:putative effector of murein hydrolase
MGRVLVVAHSENVLGTVKIVKFDRQTGAWSTLGVILALVINKNQPPGAVALAVS